MDIHTLKLKRPRMKTKVVGEGSPPSRAPPHEGGQGGTSAKSLGMKMETPEHSLQLNGRWHMLQRAGKNKCQEAAKVEKGAGDQAQGFTERKTTAPT